MRTVFNVYLLSALLITLTSFAVPVSAQDTSAVSNDRFYVLGEVQTPGDFELKPDTTLKKAIETAGGLSSRADKSGAVLLRGDEKIKLDLVAVLGGTKPDMTLVSGDTILVKPGAYKVEGKVKNPGAYDVRSNLTLEEAVKAAGGMLEGGDLEAAYVSRGSKIIHTSTFDALKKPGEQFFLEVGDTLTIPERTVTVTGEVARPGVYTLIPGKTDKLQDAILAAGGPNKKGDLKRVQVTSSQKGKPVTRTVNTAQSTNPDNNPVLHDDDGVYVPGPAQKRKIDSTDVYQAVVVIFTLVSLL